MKLTYRDGRMKHVQPPERTCRVTRIYLRKNRDPVVILRGLTREQALAHCIDFETNSRTCNKPENRSHTAEHGPWFDGWDWE